MESNSTSNSVHSTMTDLLDRCSSPPLSVNTLENDIRSCVNDLCQRIVSITDEPFSSASIIYNPIPSPVFKRKSEEQSSSSKRTTKPISHVEEQTPKKKRYRSSTKRLSTDITNVTIPISKKEEPIEQELIDIKPNFPTANVIMPSSISANTSDYICEWDTCRK